MLHYRRERLRCTFGQYLHTTVFCGHPNLNKTLKKIEMVQSRYTTKLCALATVPYGEWLRRLQLCSLELRRLQFDLRVLSHYLQTCECVSDFFELNSTSQTRGHPYKLYKPRTYNTVRDSYFSIRVINVGPIWNSLPADCVDFSFFASFKRTVKPVDFTPLLSCYHVWRKHNSHLYIVYYYYYY